MQNPVASADTLHIPPLTVLTFKWNGWRPVFTSQHVNILRNQFAKHLTIPHRFVCITDDPTGLDCESFPLWDDIEVPGHKSHQDCFLRLKLFSAWAAEQWEQILVTDIDMMLRGNIDHMITDDDFKIIGNDDRYFGGFWLHKTGTRQFLWDDFDAEQFSGWKEATDTVIGSDQAWFNMRLGNEARYQEGTDFFMRRPDYEGPLPDMPLAVFMGSMKPWNTGPYMEEWNANI